MPDATPQRPMQGYRWEAEDKDFNAERIAALEAEVERLRDAMTDVEFALATGQLATARMILRRVLDA